MFNKIFFKNLQMFAEGGDGEGSGPDSASESQVEGEPGVQTPDAGEKKQRKIRSSRIPNIEYGIIQNDAETTEDAAANDSAEQAESRTSYEEIKKQYEKEIGADIQNAVHGRFKNVKATEAELKRTQALLARFAEFNYNIKPGEDGRLDLDAVEKAIHDDDSFYEDLAASMGTSTEFARQFDDQKRELEQHRAEAIHREELAKFEQIVNQAQKAREIFPDLDLDAEMLNPDFARLVAANVPVETAYRVIHDADITRSAMQYAAQQARLSVATSIQAGQNRPTENGLGRGAAANVQRITDPRLLTKEQRKDIRARVARGETISW